MKEQETHSRHNQWKLFASVLTLGKSIFHYAETSVKYIKKSISNKMKDLVQAIILMTIGLFFLIISFIFILATAYHGILRYLMNDPMVATGILGGVTLVIALLIFRTMNRKIDT